MGKPSKKELSDGAGELLDSIVAVFDRFDLNKNGTMEPEELWLLLRTLEPTTFQSEAIPSALYELFKTINKDHTGQINVREFVMWVLGEDDPLAMVATLTTSPIPPATEV